MQSRPSAPPRPVAMTLSPVNGSFSPGRCDLFGPPLRIRGYNQPNVNSWLTSHVEIKLIKHLTRDSPDDSRTGVKTSALLACLEDNRRCEPTGASGNRMVIGRRPNTDYRSKPAHAWWSLPPVLASRPSDRRFGQAECIVAFHAHANNPTPEVTKYPRNWRIRRDGLEKPCRLIAPLLSPSSLRARGAKWYDFSPARQRNVRGPDMKASDYLVQLV
jgi:hypothetical protein